MNATEAIDKIVKLLGLKFKKEKFFTTKLIDGNTEITNNLESEFGVGQTLYVVGDSTLTPAPVGTHTTREGLVLTVDEESTITKIEENVEEAQQEVVEDQVEVEQSAQSFVEAKDAQGQTRTLYSLRHTYATLELLNNSTDIHTLSKQMGNSAAMIERHYSKLSATMAAAKLA